jgi:SAM-dependent methyltransferase
MRPSINKLVGIFAETIPVEEPIYEFGSFQVPGQEAIADLRPYFPDQRYIGTDMREGRGVDRVLDLHDLDIETGEIGAAIMIDTLEHVEYPHRALKEVHRVLADRGIVLMTSVMRFPIHEHPYDYWRFTPEAFRSLLKALSSPGPTSLASPTFRTPWLESGPRPRSSRPPSGGSSSATRRGKGGHAPTPGQSGLRLTLRASHRTPPMRRHRDRRAPARRSAMRCPIRSFAPFADSSGR